MSLGPFAVSFPACAKSSGRNISTWMLVAQPWAFPALKYTNFQHPVPAEGLKGPPRRSREAQAEANAEFSVLREHNGAVSSRLSPSQMRRDVLPARCALKSSCPQGHLPAGLGASLNPALNCHAAQRRKKCVSFPSANGRELLSKQDLKLRAGKLTPNVPIFGRKHEVRVSGQTLPQQSLS